MKLLSEVKFDITDHANHVNQVFESW